MGVERNPKDSMKSTWQKDKSTWKRQHYMIDFLNLYHVTSGKEIPVHAMNDKIPPMTQWSCHVWIIAHALWPILIQRGIQAMTGRSLHPIGAFFLYAIAMQLNSIHEIHILRRLGHRYGFFDGENHARDSVPDVSVAKVVASLELTTTIRPMLAIFLSYRRSQPASLSWWLPLELALYSVVLDFFFYAYHRSCHEIDSLWQYHRTHHLTKHPNPLLSSFADSEQEFLEIALIPFLTWATLKYAFGLPMGFHDWWLCHEYVIFSEAFGHSGLRVFVTTTSFASPFLTYFGCELQTEDHDLHHRRGWKKSSNYGKQTRLWDRVFGTCGERLEALDAQVDYDASFNMPLL